VRPRCSNGVPAARRPISSFPHSHDQTATATYVWQGRERTTSFIAEALTAWFEPDEVLVVLTPTAERNANWEHLQLAVPAVKPLEIPEPGSGSALWEIFRVLSANVTTEDEIIHALSR